MVRDRFELVREVFGGALERRPDEWSPYLTRACGGDIELRSEVESLLESYQDSAGFLERPEVNAPRQPPVLALDSAQGLRVGAYEIERRIGRGGMGTVYSATRADELFQKRVAIKLLRRDVESSEIVRRFHAERQILAALEHPSIARLIDGGTTDDGRPYLVMEHVEGRPIDEFCDVHELSIPERLDLFRSVCAAVQFAHRNLVVHRDLKPSNILVTGEGEPKLLDFGIAKLLAPELSAGTIAAAETVMRAMTPDYASPEQILGKPVTTASDVYSLGVLLYLLLAGRHPFEAGGSPAEVLWAIHLRDPEAPSEAIRGSDRKLARRLEGDLDNIVLMALRNEPERRYASADQLSEDLRRHLAGHPVSARRDTVAYRWGKLVSRHRVGVSVTAALATALLGFGLLMAAQRQEIAAERDRVEGERQRTETERRRAEQVTGFLVDLFEVSDPFSGGSDTGDVTARELLDRGARRLSTELEGQPELRADLSHAIGVIYRRLGLPDEATMHLGSAFETRRRLLGEGHPKVARSLDEQGLLLLDRGEYASAGDSLRQALAVRRRLFGEGHLAVAESLDHLAALAQRTGEFHRAERLSRDALAIYRDLLGDDAKVAAATSQLAINLKIQGDFDGAEALFREALAVQSRLLGEDHLAVAQTRTGLAQVLLATGSYDDAAILYRQALQTMRRALGDDHVEVAYCVHSLAAVRAVAGETAAAESLFREALEMLRKRLGDDHPDLCTTHDYLASVLFSTGDLSGAEHHYRRALTIRRTAMGEDSPYLVISLTGLARVAIARGDLVAAERLLKEATEIGRRAFPGGHWRISVAESVLGECLTRAGRYREAESLLLGSYRSLRTIRGDRAKTTTKTLDRLVRLYEASGRPEEVSKLRGERQPPAAAGPNA
ncbi:MAG: serine/threonine protein kinase [bacterium]|nr:serine/threonine protein kinase [bacterium]